LPVCIRARKEKRGKEEIFIDVEGGEEKGKKNRGGEKGAALPQGGGRRKVLLVLSVEDGRKKGKGRTTGLSCVLLSKKEKKRKSINHIAPWREEVKRKRGKKGGENWAG